MKDKLLINIDVKIERGNDNPVNFILFTGGSVAQVEWSWPPEFFQTEFADKASMKLTGERWSWDHQAVHSLWKSAANCASTGLLTAPLEAVDDNPCSKADSVRALQVYSRHIRYQYRSEHLVRVPSVSFKHVHGR